MEGRKLTLVPYKRWMEYHRWHLQRTPHLPPNPHLTELSQLQHELQSLMDRHDLSETEKIAKVWSTLATNATLSPETFGRNSSTYADKF